MPEETKNSILESINKLSDTKGYYWSYACIILQTVIHMIKRDADNEDVKESEVITDSNAHEDIKNLELDQNKYDEKKSDQDANTNLEETDTSCSTSLDLFKFDRLEDILDRSGIFHCMQVTKFYLYFIYFYYLYL